MSARFTSDSSWAEIVCRFVGMIGLIALTASGAYWGAMLVLELFAFGFMVGLPVLGIYLLVLAFVASEWFDA